MVEEENKELVIYGYKNSEGKMLWTTNLEFAKIRANQYETYGVYEEKTSL